MQRLMIVTVVAGLVSSPAAALARPPYPTIFQEYYAENKPVFEAAKIAKCLVCHSPPEQFPFSGGKPRNSYGLALGKHFPAKEFSKLKKPDQKAELAAKLKEALRAAEADKNKEGVAWGEIIKAGKLPVVPPEGAKSEESE